MIEQEMAEMLAKHGLEDQPMEQPMGKEYRPSKQAALRD
jgi:hypothetical protein